MGFLTGWDNHSDIYIKIRKGSTNMDAKDSSDLSASNEAQSQLTQLGQYKMEKIECKQEELQSYEKEEERPVSSHNTSQPDSRTSTHSECQESDEDSSWSSKNQTNNSTDVKKEEEPVKRGLRPKEKKQRSSEKDRPRVKKEKKKQKRQMRELEKDDPRNRGVPKQKKIRKRRNKPKAISDQAKREAEIKREQQEHIRKINKRGKKPVIKKIRGLKKRLEMKGVEIIKLEEGGSLKLEESESSSSESDGELCIKRRTSRLQKRRERAEDKRKVDGLMVLRGERERRQQLQALVRMERLMAAKFGTKMLIKIDPNCKYYSQYKCRKDEIEKCGKLYCQIYNSHPVPSSGMHFFQLKIARLSFQSVTVGLITSRNFQQQYSRDKSHCICFDAYTHSTYVEGAKTDLQVQVKLNDVIRTVVDIPNATVHWYINHDFIAEAIIPSHMAAMPLYPYLEVSNKWIKLRINDFQE